MLDLDWELERKSTLRFRVRSTARKLRLDIMISSVLSMSTGMCMILCVRLPPIKLHAGEF